MYFYQNFQNQGPQCRVYQYNTSIGAFSTPAVNVEPNGVIYTGSQVRKDDISDGASATPTCWVRSILFQDYTSHATSGNAAADKSDIYCMYSGCTFDNERSTYQSTPLQDRSEVVNQDTFGSAHVNSCCFVFCDGSTHWINYSIDPTTHKLLGCRNDSQPVDLSGL